MNMDVKHTLPGHPAIVDDKAESVMDRVPAASTVAPEVTDLPPATSAPTPDADGPETPSDLPPSEGGK